MATVRLLFNYFTNIYTNTDFSLLRTFISLNKLYLNIFYSFWHFVCSIYLGNIYNPINFSSNSSTKCSFTISRNHSKSCEDSFLSLCVYWTNWSKIIYKRMHTNCKKYVSLQHSIAVKPPPGNYTNKYVN